MLSRLAARILGGFKATEEEVQSLAGSVLSQDETPPEQPKAKPKRAKKPVYEHKV